MAPFIPGPGLQSRDVGIERPGLSGPYRRPGRVPRVQIAQDDSTAGEQDWG